jgi:hypothetical protein
MKSRKSRKRTAKRSGNKGKTRKTTLLTKKSRPNRKQKRRPADPSNPLERALALMKKGLSQAGAARTIGVTEQRVARYRKATTTSKRKGRNWVIVDRRPSTMYIAEKGKISVIAVPHRAKSAIGRYWNDVDQFLTDNDPAHLRPYAGHSVRDINRKKHFFETDPHTLRMLDSIGDISFVEIYAHVAQ